MRKTKATATPDDRELTEAELALAYALFLGREASTAELERLHAKGSGLSRVRRVFMASPEFSTRMERFLPQHDVRIRRRMHPGKAARYLHLHIPKTAGTTLSAILSTAIGHEQSVTVSENARGPLGGRDPQELIKARLIFGHLSYEAMAYFPQDTQAICVLRRPGDRLLSFYRYVVRTQDHPLHGKVVDEEMSFGTFLEFTAADPRHRRGVDNVQMRIISGMTGVEHLGNETRVFEEAVSNVLSGRVLFGLMERFDAFQAWLQRQGVIRKISQARLNAADRPAALDEALEGMTEDQRALFDAYVAWDNLLYDICERVDLTRTAQE